MAPLTRWVLSIDGGGIRGVIPALVIAYLEQRTQRRVADLFDLVAGTSTGGILALGLTQPSGSGTPESRYHARELAQLYIDKGSAIFDQGWWRRLRSVRGVFEEAYGADALEQVLYTYFGERPLADCRCPTMVACYDIERRKPVFLKSFKSEHGSVLCRSAARATSAAPTYFEPASLILEGETRALIDGGVFINSPSVSAYAEALKLFPDEEIRLVSVGTGELVSPIPRERAASWGSAGWVLPLLDCMFDGVSRAADHQMRLFLDQRYHRFQTPLMQASDALDDASPENIRALVSVAESLIETSRQRLDQLTEQLLA